MCFYLRRLVTILSLLALCACGTATSPTPGEYTPNGAEAVTQLSATPSPALSVSAEAVNNSTKTAQLPSLPGLDALTVSLHCINHIEAQWGSGSGEFGLCPAPSDAWIRGPYPPTLSAQGDLFIVDKANQRILRYSGNTMSQAISIPSSYVLNDVCGYSNRGWPNLSVSRDRLFFLFSVWQDRLVDQLAVLSLEGREIQVIDLEAYYPLHSLFMNSLIADRKGGVYLLLPPAGIVHFDADLRPTLIYLGSEADYENLVVGWDGNLYTYSVKHDRLDNWGADNRLFMRRDRLSSMDNVIAATPIVSPTYTRLLGADIRGRPYFRTVEQDGDPWLVRISASGDQRVIATAPDGWPLPFVLAADGSLYGTTYNSRDPDTSVKPRIIRCVFDQDPTLTPTP
jgi:hypothetical protein